MTGIGYTPLVPVSVHGSWGVTTIPAATTAVATSTGVGPGSDNHTTTTEVKTLSPNNDYRLPTLTGVHNRVYPTVMTRGGKGVTQYVIFFFFFFFIIPYTPRGRYPTPSR